MHEVFLSGLLLSFIIFSIAFIIAAGMSYHYLENASVIKSMLINFIVTYVVALIITTIAIPGSGFTSGTLSNLIAIIAGLFMALLYAMPIVIEQYNAA